MSDKVKPKPNRGANKGKMGAPLKMSEEKFIEKMTARGVQDTFELLLGIPFATEETISDFFGVSRDRLLIWVKEKYDCTFKALKDQKMKTLVLRLVGKQFEFAFKGNAPMLIWLGKQYAGQHERIEQHINVLPTTTRVISYDEKEQIEMGAKLIERKED